MRALGALTFPQGIAYTLHCATQTVRAPTTLELCHWKLVGSIPGARSKFCLTFSVRLLIVGHRILSKTMKKFCNLNLLTKRPLKSLKAMSTL